MFAYVRRCSHPQKTLEKRTPANNYEQTALNWGTGGRGFKSPQPDLLILDFYESKG